MPLTYDSDLARQISNSPSSYDERQAILYALSIGMGQDPALRPELPFVFEKPALRLVPTMAVIMANGSIMRELDVDRTMLVHGEQRLTLHRDLPARAALQTDMRVIDIVDKGADKGALIYAENVIREVGNPAPLATSCSTLVARGDGGFGGPPRPTLRAHAIPMRSPDVTQVTQTRADQALLFRLNGDLNPLHADADFARRAGFDAPILHGSCLYGIACRAVLATAAGYDPGRIGTFDVRFTSPVFPGEAIATDMWIDDDVVSFRCRVEERGVTVIDNGRCLLRAA